MPLCPHLQASPVVSMRHLCNPFTPFGGRVVHGGRLQVRVEVPERNRLYKEVVFFVHEDIKKWLSQYTDEVRHIDLLIERVSALEYQINSPRSPQLDGMPHGSGRVCDPIGGAIARLDDLKSQIEAARESEEQLYRERDAAINQITGKRWPERQAVLRFRYLDMLPWAEICGAMFGSKADFDEKQESYLRRVYHVHGQALKELSKIVPLRSGRNEEE